MLILITGTDHFRILLEKQALEKAFLSQEKEGQVSSFDFEDNSRSEYIRSVQEESEGGLFATPKLIILQQLSALSPDVQGKILKTVTTRTDTSWVIVEQGNLRKTDVYTKKLASLPGIKVVTCSAPTEEILRSMLGELNQASGIHFEPGAERVFLARVGNDTAKLYQEHAKLATYKQKGIVTQKDVEDLLEPSLEDTGFQALDALSRGEKERATVLFRELLLWKKDALPILGLCAWQLRQMIILREAFDKGVRQSRELAQDTGISPYVVGKLLQILPAFPPERLRAAHARIWQYDHDIKKGLIEQGVAIDLLVWEM